MYYTHRRAAATAFVTVICLIAISQNAHAQRTMRYQDLLTAGVTFPFADNADVGGSFCYGQYTLDGFWTATVYSVGRRQPEGDYRRIQTQTIRLQGAYMHRLISDRKRIVSLYSGGGAFIGYEFYDPFKKLPDYIEKTIADNAFIYGICGSVEVEFFIMKQIALTISVNLPLTFGSESKWLRTNTIAGVRFNI